MIGLKKRDIKKALKAGAKAGGVSLASDAHVLLADEPTGNLDETTADEIIALLKKTAHELGKCVVVVTHSKHLAEEADEILEIKNGAISFLSE